MMSRIITPTYGFPETGIERFLRIWGPTFYVVLGLSALIFAVVWMPYNLALAILAIMLTWALGPS